MDIGTTAGDESGQQETETWEGPTPRQRVWSNCIAFLATILVVVGELSSEQNFIGLIVIGGGLAVLNVLITASNLEKANKLEKELRANSLRFEDVAFRERSRSHRRARDMTSIDLEDLSFEDENHILADETESEEAERTVLLSRHRSYPRSYRRQRNDIEPEAENERQRRYAKTKKRTRRASRYDEENEPAELPLRRSKDAGTRGRKSRSHKIRKEKHGRSESVERYPERDKREVKRRDKKHKKKKRVTIAPGSQEHIVIGL